MLMRIIIGELTLQWKQVLQRNLGESWLDIHPVENDWKEPTWNAFKHVLAVLYSIYKHAYSVKSRKDTKAGSSVYKKIITTHKKWAFGLSFQLHIKPVR